MSNFKGVGLPGFERAMNETAVLSESFKSHLWSYVLKAVEEAYKDGQERLETTIAEGAEVCERADALEAEVQELQTALEEAIETGEALFRRLACEQVRSNVLRNGIERREQRIERYRRNICEEAGCEQYIQRCSQPPAECCS